MRLVIWHPQPARDEEQPPRSFSVLPQVGAAVTITEGVEVDLDQVIGKTLASTNAKGREVEGKDVTLGECLSHDQLSAFAPATHKGGRSRRPHDAAKE